VITQKLALRKIVSKKKSLKQYKWSTETEESISLSHIKELQTQVVDILIPVEKLLNHFNAYHVS
jgi:hypothetical protein